MNEENNELVDTRKSFPDDAYSNQSDELTAAKSGPDDRLTILGEKLNIAESKCDSLKSKLDYMKIFFHGVPTDTAERFEQSLPTTDKPEHDVAPVNISTSDPPGYKSNVPIDKSSAEMKYHLFRKEIQKIQRITKGEDLPPLSGTHSKENDSSTKYASTPAGTEKQAVTSNIMNTIYDHPSTDRPRSNPNGFTECITIPPIRKVKKKQEMVLNMSEHFDSSYGVARRIASKGERKFRPDYAESTKKKPSVSTVGESVMSKTKRKRGRLRSVLSKNTLAAKDTNIIGKKDTKRRKYKGSISSLSQDHVSLSSPRRNRSEVVEIYHNVAIKSDSISAVSSKHSKYDPHMKFAERRSTDFSTNKNARGSQLKNLTENPKDEQESNQEAVKIGQGLKSITGGGPKEGCSMYDQTDNAYPTSEKQKTQETQHVMFHESYYDPLATRNYETPTLASRLKRSTRSYFNRFNFKNIPFVVGTSITPSHNLGLNIQQVLSIMKMRQPIVNSVAPLLIRKVSRGMQPVSMLMEHMNHRQCEGTCDKAISMTRNVIDPLEFQRSKIALIAQIRNEEAESVKQEITRREAAGVKNQSRSNLTPNTSGSRGIQDVLTNLHDQFEKMTEKYEKLQAESEKSDDKLLLRELALLEKELNAKEKEIEAVIGLYKEVMTLKRQVKTLQDKSSLVCICTESPVIQSSANLPLTTAPAVQHRTTKSLQTFSTRRGHTVGVIKEPSTSIRLASLLRQIQLYQKQLKLAT